MSSDNKIVLFLDVEYVHYTELNILRKSFVKETAKKMQLFLKVDNTIHKMFSKELLKEKLNTSKY